LAVVLKLLQNQFLTQNPDASKHELFKEILNMIEVMPFFSLSTYIIYSTTVTEKPTKFYYTINRFSGHEWYNFILKERSSLMGLV